MKAIEIQKIDITKTKKAKKKNAKNAIKTL